jgi:hypothetical protein
MKSAGIILAALAILPAAAVASHGKAGLWEVTSTMSMPQMSPAQAAQMQAMGMQMPMGHTTTHQKCMTPAEAAADMPVPPHNKDCALSNVKMEGHTYSGDVTCSGEFQGQGHFSETFDSDEHFSGTSTMTGSANGHPVNMSNTMEGKWISADCGSAK